MGAFGPVHANALPKLAAEYRTHGGVRRPRSPSSWTTRRSVRRDIGMSAWITIDKAFAGLIRRRNPARLEIPAAAPSCRKVPGSPAIVGEAEPRQRASRTPRTQTWRCRRRTSQPRCVARFSHCQQRPGNHSLFHLGVARPPSARIGVSFIVEVTHHLRSSRTSRVLRCRQAGKAYPPTQPVSLGPPSPRSYGHGPPRFRR